MSFYITLTNNIRTQPTNNGSNFIVDLPKQINLEDDWYVALVEITIIHGNEENYYKNGLFVYCSLIRSVMVGDILVPLLRRFVPTSSNPIHETMDHLMYIDVSSAIINKVEIQIRDDLGKIVDFPSGTTTVLILHFKVIE